MVISPNDFSLWARLTGNKYPSTPKERAQKGPEVQNFIQNLGKEGIIEGKETTEPKKENNLGKNIAKGALIAGGIAALGAASRDKRVQDIAQRAASTTKTKIDDFLSNLGGPRVIDRDIVDASYDVTPNPREQQSNVAPQLKSGPDSIKSGGLGTRIIGPLPDVSLQDSADFMAERINDPTYGAYGEDAQAVNIEDLNRESAQLAAFTGETIPRRDPVSGVSYDDIKQKLQNTAAARGVKEPVAVDRFTPAVEGKTFGTSGAVSKLEDIGDAKLRARRTYGPMIDAVQQKNPGINVGSMGRSMLAKAEQDRDYDIAYMVARGQGKTDETATQIARSTAGFPTGSPVGKPTPYREFLGEQRTGSIRTESIDNLLNLVKTGPQINLPESVQEPGALVQLAAGSTPSNKVPTMGATIGGSTLTDKLATKMAVDNVLDEVRKQLSGTPVPITGVTSTGLKTSVQDDNLRRIEPTPEQAQAIREEAPVVSRDKKGGKIYTSPTFDEMTGFTTPKSESISTNPLEERISKLEGKTAELRAIQENLGRAGELLSAGLDPRTTRFDSARAAGLTSKSGIKPRITNPKFQENMNLGKTQEAAIPKPSSRIFFEQDSEGRIIPETKEQRGERRVVRGPDTKTITSGGGYQPRGGVGSSIGAYGIEPTDFAQADITKRPTDTGGKQSFSKQPPSANPVESFDTANELRKIQTDQNISPEERRARSKDFLKQKMSERGISAIGESEPLRKR